MLRSVASKVAWVGRTASMVFGLALVLALILGAVTMAAAAVPGDPFKLGQSNTIDRISTLVGSASGALLRIDNEGDGPALDLRVNSGEAPMNVNSTKRVNALNADQVDGKSAAQLEGVNGLTVVRDESNFDSSSPKFGIANCRGARPAGGVLNLVGSGYQINGADASTQDVVVTALRTVSSPSSPPNAPSPAMYVRAVETKPVAGNWSVTAEAICALEGTP